MAEIVDAIRAMPSSLNDALRKLELAADLIEQQAASLAAKEK